MKIQDDDEDMDNNELVEMVQPVPLETIFVPPTVAPLQKECMRAEVVMLLRYGTRKYAVYPFYCNKEARKCGSSAKNVKR